MVILKRIKKGYESWKEERTKLKEYERQVRKIAMKKEEKLRMEMRKKSIESKFERKLTNIRNAPLRKQLRNQRIKAKIKSIIQSSSEQMKKGGAKNMGGNRTQELFGTTQMFAPKQETNNMFGSPQTFAPKNESFNNSQMFAPKKEAKVKKTSNPFINVDIMRGLK